MAVQLERNLIRPRNEGELSKLLQEHQDHRLIFLEFYQEDCQNCAKTAPVFEQLAEKFHDQQDALFLQLNVDKMKTTAQKYNVTFEPMQPLFVALMDGKEESRYEGTDIKELKKMIESFMQQRRRRTTGGGGSGEQTQQKGGQQQQQEFPKMLPTGEQQGGGSQQQQQMQQQQPPHIDIGTEGGVINIHVIDKDGKKHELSLPEGMTVSHLTDKFHGTGIQWEGKNEKPLKGDELKQLTFNKANICDGTTLRII